MGYELPRHRAPPYGVRPAGVLSGNPSHLIAMPTHSVSLTVNGQRRTADVEPRTLLVHLLRDQLDLTGTHIGCDTNQCGACTVLIDGVSVDSCLVLGVEADGTAVTTVEGLASGDRLHPLQAAFLEMGAAQCGFCIPGQLMAAAALLADIPHPTRADVEDGLAGNLCRCAGYEQIIEAVLVAAQAGVATPLADGATEA